MKLVEVIFGKGSKTYTYYSKVELVEGAKYDIVVDGYTTYSNPVTIKKVSTYTNPIEALDFFGFKIRTITSATCLQMPPRPKSSIRHVQFNKKKGVTTVIWVDGSITMVKQHPEDDWDKEKALAMCFMKKAYDNRSCFNEELEKWCDDARYEIKGE